jgi:hypothetical protein
MSNPPPKQRSPFVVTLQVIAGIAVGCCLVGLAGFAVLGTMRNSIKPTATPTAKPSTGATVQYIGPSPTSRPTISNAGKTRDNPFPKDAKVDIGGGMMMSVVFVTRPADDIIHGVNQFYATPEASEEYILIDVHVDCQKSSNEKCSFDRFQLKTVGASGNVREQPILIGIPNELEAMSEFFGGASIDGSVVFLVTKDDSSTVLIYDPLFVGNSVYIALQ